MNFHKTIGFLAALLLMVGLGAPDSFAQNETIAVTVSPARITEGQSRSVTVAVTLSEAPGANNTVSVAVALPGSFPDGSNLAASHDVDGTATAGFPAIEIVGTATTGTSVATVTATQDADADEANDTVYYHPRDKDVTITATATSGGGSPPTYDPGTGTLQVREDDQPIGAITLTADPLGLSVGGTGGTTLTASVPDELDGAALTVNITSMLTVGDADPIVSTTGTITIADGDDEGETTFSPPVDAAGSITVTANAVGYTPGMVTVQIIQRNAGDVEGFRVTIESHADGAWVGSGNKKLHVKVRRVNRFAWDWTNFEQLVVALRDTSSTGSLTNGNIYTLTASGFAEVDEDIKFSTGTPTGDRVNAAQTVVSYSMADDAFTFQFQLVATPTTTETATTFGTDTNTREQGRIDIGQRHGVYATATFTHDDGTGTATTTTLNSNDTKMDVYESPSALATVSEADKKVGDGKLVKLDLMAPPNIADGNFVVTRENADGDDVTLTDTDKLKIGDEIDIAVNVDSQSRFRDAGVQIQVIATETAGENTTAIVVKTTLKTVNFSQIDVINAAGDALMTSLALTEGLIKGKVKANAKARDGSAIKKNALYEPDNVTIQVLAKTKDQAGNFSGVADLELTADTRKPEINVLYPASGDYFSGAIGDTDTGFDQYLKPLKLIVDESVASMDVYVHKNHKINLWADESLNHDQGLVVGGVNNKVAVGDTIIYDTLGLKINNKDGGEGSAAGGSKVTLTFEVTDLVGNKNTVKLAGVFHDETAPVLDNDADNADTGSFFPNNALLDDDDNQINDATRHPVITLPEAVDSIAVIYDGSSGDDIVEMVSGVNSGEVDVPITKAFVDGRTYTLTIFTRDLAGNAVESASNLAADMRFNEQFNNPEANAFMVSNETGGTGDDASAGVIAGQAIKLVIQAIDDGGTSDDEDDRNAVTYKNVDADGNMASEVRISASSSSVRFSGKGVSDNGDGSATLNAADWKLGKREVHAKSEDVIDATTITVEHRNAGEGGTSVVAFDGSIGGLYVDAADFDGFELTAWETGVTGPAQSVWGDFDLRVVPVDEFGNPSLKVFPMGSTDSLALLDSKVKEADGNVFDEVDVTFRSNPALDDLPSLFEWPIPLAGDTFELVAPDDKRSVTIQVEVVESDDRINGIRSTERFSISAPLDLSITLWVPGLDGDQAGNDVTIPAGGSVEVTARAEGLNEGDMVTFTVDGEAQEAVAADADGFAGQMIELSGSGTVSVTAMSGQYTTSLDITHAEQEGRRSFADANGDPVYFVVPDKASGSVGVDDFLALVAAWGSSPGDANYNPQADINDDETVDVSDFLMFITSWGRTVDGSATKPIVLAPGLNENAEFGLSLGSERVVAGELVAVDVSLANVASLIGYGFTLNYDAAKFEFVSVAPADEDLLTSTGGETLFHHIAGDGQVEVATGMYNGTAVSGGGDIVRFVFRVLYEFEDNARFEIANGLVFDPSQLQNPAVVAGVLELQSTPREFALHQNFPNPFNPDTTIKYDLAESADVTLQIYNVLGQVVRTLVAAEAQNAGRYQIRWNGMDERGVPVSSGVYFYQITAEGKFQQVQKLMLLK